MSTQQAVEIYFWAQMFCVFDKIHMHLNDAIENYQDTPTYKEIGQALALKSICAWTEEISLKIFPTVFLEQVNIQDFDKDKLYSTVWGYTKKKFQQIVQYPGYYYENISREELAYQVFCQWYRLMLNDFKALLDTLEDFKLKEVFNHAEIKSLLTKEISKIPEVRFFGDYYIRQSLWLLKLSWKKTISGLIYSRSENYQQQIIRQALEIYFWSNMLYSIGQIGEYMDEIIIDPRETATYQNIGRFLASEEICAWGMEESAMISQSHFFTDIDIMPFDSGNLHVDIWMWAEIYLKKTVQNSAQITLDVSGDEIAYQLYCQWYLGILVHFKALMDTVEDEDLLVNFSDGDIRPTLVELITALEELDYIKHPFIDKQLTTLENLWVNRITDLVEEFMPKE